MLASEGLEDRKTSEDLRHRVAVAESRGRVAVDLDEARPFRGQERVEAGEDDVGLAGIDRDPAGFGRRGPQEAAKTRHIALEGAARHACRELQQSGPRVPQRVPVAAADELGPQQGGHGMAVESDADLGETSPASPSHCWSAADRIGRERPVIVGDGTVA